jgi:hypothetical protein
MNESNSSNNTMTSGNNSFLTQVEQFLQTGNDGSPYSERMQKDMRRTILAYKAFADNVIKTDRNLNFSELMEMFLQKGNEGAPYSERMQKDMRRTLTGFKASLSKPKTETTVNVPQVNQMTPQTVQVECKPTLQSQVEEVAVSTPPPVTRMQDTDARYEIVNGRAIYPTDPDEYMTKAPEKQYVDYGGLDFEIRSHIESGRNLLIEGHSGIGKTQKVEEISAELNIPKVTLMCNEGTKISHIKGHIEMDGTMTPFRLGALPTAIECANKHPTKMCIIYIDELALLTQQMQGILNETLDFRKSVTIENLGITYKLEEGAKLIVIASTNPSSYGGRNPINGDLNSRFDVKVVANPTVDQVEKIVDWGNIPDNLRKGMLGMYEQLASASHTDEVDYTYSPRDLDGNIQQLIDNFKLTNEEISEDDSMFTTTAFTSVVNHIYAKFRAEPDSHKRTVAKIIRSCTSIQLSDVDVVETP